MTITGRKIVENVVYYQISQEDGKTDWRRLWEVPSLNDVIKYEITQRDGKIADLPIRAATNAEVRNQIRNSDFHFFTSESEHSDDESDKEFEVQDILGRRIVNGYETEFLVHWGGWPKEEATWEPEGNLDCADMIEKFNNKSQRRPPKRSPDESIHESYAKPRGPPTKSRYSLPVNVPVTRPVRNRKDNRNSDFHYSKPARSQSSSTGNLPGSIPNENLLIPQDKIKTRQRVEPSEVLSETHVQVQDPPVTTTARYRKKKRNSDFQYSDSPNTSPVDPKGKKKIPMDLRPHACPSCPMRFMRHLHLTYHIRTHTKEKPYICPLCRRGFTRVSDRARHIRRVHVKHGEATWEELQSKMPPPKFDSPTNPDFALVTKPMLRNPQEDFQTILPLSILENQTRKGVTTCDQAIQATTSEARQPVSMCDQATQVNLPSPMGSVDLSGTQPIRVMVFQAVPVLPGTVPVLPALTISEIPGLRQTDSATENKS